MPKPSDMITLQTARLLAEGGSVRRATAVPIPGGFAVELDVGMRARALCSSRQRRQPRKFRSLDAAAKAVRDIGLDGMNVRLADWRPEQRSLS